MTREHKKGSKADLHDIELEEEEIKREYLVFLPLLVAVFALIIFSASRSAPAQISDLVRSKTGAGYFLVYMDGTVESRGDAVTNDDFTLEGNIIAAELASSGLWGIDQVGNVDTLDSASYHGELDAQDSPGQVVDILADVNGRGYRLVTERGVIYDFNLESIKVSSDSGPKLLQGRTKIVAATMTASGNGFWLVDDKGTIYNFGDAFDFGSVTGVNENDPVVDISSNSDGSGLVLATRHGQVKIIGAAIHYGDLSNKSLSQEIIGIDSTSSGKGYWLLDAAGNVYAFGDAKVYSVL